ncbi:(4Fe-4S)-binding protein [Candidatus Aerophobetes bacterium]|uniref:(4Fe-4S)-binding protein n=1 Tax=Aerophobetes bacterium TaxID=2030807 RepID=A0A497E5R4_UNCAE|nr:MAG: (4Fe-4S)-binding protein [Candidatus Aerophobetes bacterium]
MKQIVVISGKGGTGKTVISASFASLAEKKVMADCDVDAADLHLLLHPTVKEEYDFLGKVARIDQERCTQCGRCQEVCRFEAISDFTIDPVSCEGCGVCAYVCPQKAIEMVEDVSGKWFVSETKYGPLVHAKLGIAEENSGKLVSLVKQKARQIAEEEGCEFIIIDGPPGIGCPVIASLSGVDVALIVSEPTLSGIHDLERVAGVAHHFGVRSLVCINKYDLNMENSQQIEEFCQSHGIEIAGKIPFDSTVTEAMVCGKSIVEYSDGKVSRRIKEVWEKVKEV